MAHFAKLDLNNIVIFVTVGRDEDNELDLSAKTGDTYLQTSYNTRGGIYYDSTTNEPAEDQSRSFRKNYAGVGYKYDIDRDAFIPPKPYPSWVLNDFSCLWEAPVSCPQDSKVYKWNEFTLSWEETQSDLLNQKM